MTHTDSAIEISRIGSRWELRRGGRPYFVRGAVGGMYPERVAAAGGNSIRAGIRDLNRAQDSGLTVLVGLPFGKQRRGFDYSDSAAVRKQLDDVRLIVLEHKDHPALLMWALGNELEIHTTPQERECLWKAVDDAAAMIHQVDGRHPVITPVGGQYREMLWELDLYCPALDAVGLNSYADMLTLPEDVARNGSKRAYVITEFGPRGHWQVAKTPWGMPIEDTSTDKAAFYLEAYRHAVADRPDCLGSFVFHWAQHHEKTHTWYGMYLPDGSPTEAVDVMQYLWTGHYPANRCPRIGPGEIRVECPESLARSQDVFAPGERVKCSVEASDPEGEPLRITWDLRKDVADNPNVGGDHEETTPPIGGAVLSTRGNEAEIRLPEQAGPYRVFVYVHDPHGAAATANVPILAQ